MRSALGTVARRRWWPLWWGLWALLLGTLAMPSGALAFGRIEQYDIELTLPPDSTEAHYRIRFQYRSDPPKIRGFKFFGWDRPSRVVVTDADGESISHLQPDHYDQERIEWTVPRPDAQGLQTVWVEFDQPLLVSYGWRSRVGRIPWAHQFKIPVDHMTVTSHISAQINGPGCHYDGTSTRCTTAQSSLFEVNAIRLPAPTVGSSFLILMALLAVGLGLVVWRYAAVRRALVAERGVLPPAPAQLAFAGSGYRAPPELPLAAEPRLSDEDATMLRKRLLMVLATLLPTAALALLLNGRSRLPMPTVVGLGLLMWIACALFLVGRDSSWQTVVLPGVLQGAVGALALFGLSYGEIAHSIGNVFPFIVFGGGMAAFGYAQYKGWLPNNSGGGSGFSSCSSCSSCGGGGCGGGCGGCGG